MLKIKIICLGKLKEKAYVELEKEYLKRLSPFAKVKVVELSEVPYKSAEMAVKAKEKEADLLPNFVVGEKGPHEPSFLEKETKPPNQFTEATLLPTFLDSLEIIELAIILENELGSTITNYTVENWNTIGDIATTYRNIKDE
jgi:acyl carrier protein